MGGGGNERFAGSLPPPQTLFSLKSGKIWAVVRLPSVHLSQRDGCIRALRAWTLGRGGGASALPMHPPPPKYPPHQRWGGGGGVLLKLLHAPLLLFLSKKDKRRREGARTGSQHPLPSYLSLVPPPPPPSSTKSMRIEVCYLYVVKIVA
nr:hypothetical protein [Morchella crassipes]